jgi:hypothetical protein
MTSSSGAKLHARSARQCSTAGCAGIPEPKDEYCLECQLAGRAGELGRSTERQPSGRSVNGRSTAQPFT